MPVRFISLVQKVVCSVLVLKEHWPFPPMTCQITSSYIILLIRLFNTIKTLIVQAASSLRTAKADIVASLVEGVVEGRLACGVEEVGVVRKSRMHL